MSTSTLRPNSTSTFDGTIAGGAGSAHAALSDDNDLTGITLDPPSGATPGEGWIGGFTDLTLPAGAVIGYVGLRVRASESIVPSGGTLQGALKSGTRVLLTGSAVVNDTQTWQIGYGYAPITDAEADAFTAVINAAGGAALLVREAYVDVVYVLQPVVNAQTPTGTVTTTNLPEIEWSITSTDLDGGDLAYYQVRVFTDAQYGDAAFNPLTSTATAESGIVNSTGTRYRVPDTLVDDTYRAYVRIAQDIPGVGLHWSDFDTVDFTIDVDLPADPTISATADSANGRFSLAVAAVAGIATTDRLEVERSFDAGVTWEPVRTTYDNEGTDDMLYVVAEGVLADTADTTSHVVPLPAPAGGILADDLLIAFAGVDGNPTFTWPAGWTELVDQAGNGSAVRGGAAWKRATGGEQGSITVTTSASEGGGFRILLVRGAYKNTSGRDPALEPSFTEVPYTAGGTTGSAANTDPPSMIGYAGWIVAENFLWIAALANDGNVAITAGPSGYTNYGNTRWANASGAGVATAVKRSAAFSENPGAWTHTAEDTLNWMVQVRPRNALLTVYDYETDNGQSVRYRARSLHEYNGEWAASAWISTADSSWSSSSWWLKSPNQPDLNVAVEVREIQTISRAGRQGVFQALGATSVVVISDTRGPRTGEITLRTQTEAHQDALDALLDTTDTLLLHGPVGQGPLGYVRFGNHSRTRAGKPADAAKTWETLEFVVVGSPPGPVVEWAS